MSIKIHNGKQITPKTFTDLMSWQTKLKDAIQIEIKRLAAQKIAEMTTDLIDYAAQHTDKETVTYVRTQYPELHIIDNPLMHNALGLMKWAWNKRRQHNEQSRIKQQDPSFDYEADLYIFPLPNKMLALFFTQQETIQNIWENYEGVTDYAYYNNADHPDSVTAKAWENHKNDWMNALDGGRKAPSETGLHLQFHPTYLSPTQEEITKQLPMWMDRCVNLAREEIANETFYAKMKEKYGPNFTHVEHMHEFLQVSRDVRTWMESGAGKEAVTLRTDAIKKQLPENLTPYFTQPIGTLCTITEDSDYVI